MVAEYVRGESGVIRLSRLVLNIPDALQGRVNSVFRLMLFGSQALGAAATGLLLDTTGTGGTVLILTVPQALLALATHLSREVRAAA